MLRPHKILRDVADRAEQDYAIACEGRSERARMYAGPLILLKYAASIAAGTDKAIQRLDWSDPDMRGAKTAIDKFIGFCKEYADACTEPTPFGGDRDQPGEYGDHGHGSGDPGRQGSAGDNSAAGSEHPEIGDPAADQGFWNVTGVVVGAGVLKSTDDGFQQIHGTLSLFTGDNGGPGEADGHFALTTEDIDNIQPMLQRVRQQIVDHLESN